MASDWMMNNTKQLDPRDADWDNLNRLIKKKFNKICAKRNVIDAKVQWYHKHYNWDSFAKIYSKKLDMSKGDDPLLNGFAWDIFINITDKAVLNKIIPWMKKLVQKYPQADDALDTYANLLYKAGRKQEAIQWEEKAVSVASAAHKSEYYVVIEEMKNGQPTYLSQGAIWSVR